MFYGGKIMLYGNLKIAHTHKLQGIVVQELVFSFFFKFQTYFERMVLFCYRIGCFYDSGLVSTYK